MGLNPRETVGIIVGIAGVATILIMLVLYALMICKYCFYKHGRQQRTQSASYYDAGIASGGTGAFGGEYSQKDAFSMSPRGAYTSNHESGVS